MRRPPSIDREAFALVRHVTAVSDFYDDAQIKTIYYAEIETLVKEQTRAAHVVVFDNAIRGTGQPKRRDADVREPLMNVHNDYTLKSGPARACSLIPEDCASRLLHHRFLEINVWRPIRGPLKTKPLAVCDASSLRQEDFVAADLIYADRIGEYYALAYHPRQRWYYVPDMQPDEVILLKCYDSDSSVPLFGAHGAFDHPCTPLDAPPRESIEVRAFAFFGTAPLRS